MASGGASSGEEARRAEGVCLSLLSGVSSGFASPQIQRKPRSLVPRAAPSQPWGLKLPVLPPAPAKKKPAKKATKPAAKKRPGRRCEHCGATETPLWRTSPTDRRVKLCNACGIKVVRTPGAVVPELVHLPPPAKATTAVAEQSHPPPQEIQDSECPPEPDSPIYESMLDFDVYLLKRTSPRRAKSPPPPPPPPTAESAPAAAAPAPAKEKDKPVKCCLHCGATTTIRQWRTGPLGRGTLCNACGVCYMKGGLVPEYRPAASPTFNPSEHSCKHREVLQIREMKDHPAPPAAFQPCGNRKRRKGKGKGKKSKGAQRLHPEPVLLKRRRERKGKEQHRQPPQPAAATQPRAGDGMVVQQHLPSPPPPALLPHAGDGMGLPHLPPPPLALLLRAADDIEMEQHLLALPPALPHAGDEVMMGDEPIPPPDPFLFDGPATPRIIDDEQPVTVIVIDDD